MPTDLEFEQRLADRFDELENALARSNAELAQNQNVIDSIRELKNVTAPPKKKLEDLKGKDFFDPKDWAKGIKLTEKFLVVLIESVGVWSSEKSNWADHTAAAMKTIGYLLDIGSVIPVIGPVFSLLGSACKLFGTIFGFWGAPKQSKQSIYFEALTQMVNDAVDRVNTEQVNQELLGALAMINARMYAVSDINANSPLFGDMSAVFPELTVNSFIETGERELGIAFKNLDYNLGSSKKANSKNIAETFYLASALMSAKLQYLVMGIAFFYKQEREKTEEIVWTLLAKRVHNRSTLLIDYLCFYYKGLIIDRLEPWMVRPDLEHAEITSQVYRLEPDQFAVVRNLLRLTHDRFWPQGIASVEKGSSFRLTTVREYRSTLDTNKKEHLRAYLISNRRILEDNDWIVKNKLTAQLKFVKPRDYDEGMPSQLWTLTSDNNELQQEAFVFYVYPTARENEKYLWYDKDLYTKEKWKGAPRLIIGSFSSDKVFISEVEDKGKAESDHVPQKSKMVELDYFESLEHDLDKKGDKKEKFYCPVWLLVENT